MTIPQDVILQGDCLELFKTISDGSIDMTFADPPFNLHKKYTNCKDNLEFSQYLDWCKKWLSEMVVFICATLQRFVTFILGHSLLQTLIACFFLRFKSFFSLLFFYKYFVLSNERSFLFFNIPILSYRSCYYYLSPSLLFSKLYLLNLAPLPDCVPFKSDFMGSVQQTND